MTSIRDINIKAQDSFSIDAFGRWRVSNPQSLFDGQFEYDKNSIIWDEDTNGASASSTHNANRASVSMTLTSASSADGHYVIRQSRRYHRYQPGKSQLMLCTFVFDSGQENLIQRAGYFDAANGLFLEQNNTTINFVRRTSTSGSPADNVVPQNDWNMDKMNGTGPSGITLDLSKSQILFIDIEWLGVGRVRMGFVIDGKICYCHQFLNANKLDVVYMGTANLPIRYEIRASGGALSSNATLEQICSSVISEGGASSVAAMPFWIDSNTTPISVGTTLIPIISIRPKATFNGKTVRTLIRLQSWEVFADDNIHLRILYDATLTGASWASVDSDSIMEYDVSANTVANGILTDGHYVTGGTGKGQVVEFGIRNQFPLTLDIAGGNPKTMTIAAVKLSAGTTNVYGGFGWLEQR